MRQDVDPRGVSACQRCGQYAEAHEYREKRGWWERVFLVCAECKECLEMEAADDSHEVQA